MKYFLKALSNYFDFKGRSRRKEFWYFVLFSGILSQLAYSLDYILFDYNMYDIDGPIFFCGFGVFMDLALLIPGLSVAWRRMHDLGKSGWYCFIPIYGWLILPLTNGDSSDNDYGSDPKI